MATATVPAYGLGLSAKEAQFVVDLLFHHVGLCEGGLALAILMALRNVGLEESDQAPFNDDLDGLLCNT